VQGILRSRWALFAGVGLVAAGIAAALIAISVTGGSSDEQASLPPTTTVAQSTPRPTHVAGLAGTEATLKLLRGIPQKLNVLGNPNAPVTMIEFADLQCPFCREYTLNALPTIVEKYVRAGKVKLVFSGMHFIGPDSEKALRAAYAAGLQGKLWQYIDLLYRNQQAENSGWVGDDLLRNVATSLRLDPRRLLSDMSSAEVTKGIAASDEQADRAKVSSTPTFFAGRTGETLVTVNVTSLTPDAFRPTLDSLTK
jgi:protein-disulfide isomerase